MKIAYLMKDRPDYFHRLDQSEQNVIIGAGPDNIYSDEDLAKMADADAIIVSAYPVTEQLLAACQQLKIIQRTGVGYENIESIYNEDIGATKVITIINYANRYLKARTERIGYDKMSELLRARGPIILLRKRDGVNHYYVVKGFLANERKIVVNDGYDEDVILPAQSLQSEQDMDIAIIFNKKGEGIKLQVGFSDANYLKQ